MSHSFNSLPQPLFFSSDDPYTRTHSGFHFYNFMLVVMVAQETNPQNRRKTPRANGYARPCSARRRLWLLSSKENLLLGGIDRGAARHVHTWVGARDISAESVRYWASRFFLWPLLHSPSKNFRISLTLTSAAWWTFAADCDTFSRSLPYGKRKEKRQVNNPSSILGWHISRQPSTLTST